MRCFRTFRDGKREEEGQQSLGGRKISKTGASTSSRRPRDRPLPARRSWRRGSSAFRYLVVYVTPPGSHETPPSDPSAGRLAGGSRCHRRWPAEPPSHRNSESLAAQRVVVTTPTLRRSGFAIIRLHRGSSGPDKATFELESPFQPTVGVLLEVEQIIGLFRHVIWGFRRRGSKRTSRLHAPGRLANTEDQRDETVGRRAPREGLTCSRD